MIDQANMLDQLVKEVSIQGNENINHRPAFQIANSITHTVLLTNSMQSLPD